MGALALAWLVSIGLAVVFAVYAWWLAGSVE